VIKIISISVKKMWRLTEILLVFAMLVMFGPAIVDKAKEKDVPGRAVRAWDWLFGNGKRVIDTVRIDSLKKQLENRKAQLDQDKQTSFVNLGALTGPDYTRLKDANEMYVVAQKKAINYLEKELAELVAGQVTQSTRDLAEAEIRAADEQGAILRDLNTGLAHLHSYDRAVVASEEAARKAGEENATAVQLASLSTELARYEMAIGKLDRAAKANVFPVTIGTQSLLSRKQVSEAIATLHKQKSEKSKQLEELFQKQASQKQPLGSVTDPPTQINVNDLLGTK
jgi:hypothetical protein